MSEHIGLRDLGTKTKVSRTDSIGATLLNPVCASTLVCNHFLKSIDQDVEVYLVSYIPDPSLHQTLSESYERAKVELYQFVLS